MPSLARQFGDALGGMIGQLGRDDVSGPDARIEAVDQGMLPFGLDRRITGPPSVNTEAASGRMTAIGAFLPSKGFVRVTAGRLRMARQAQTQAAIRPRGRATRLAPARLWL